MSIYELEVRLKSPALAGSGTGFGAEIDTDVVFDDIGIPYIPAKRIKGCLRDAAEVVREMFEIAEIPNEAVLVDKTFGEPGAVESAPVYFSNLYLKDHGKIRSWLRYLTESDKFSGLITRHRILDTFTEVRQQTMIAESGVAEDHSLRSIRVLRKELLFCGEVRIETGDTRVLNTLLLACLNFRRFGTKRNRGLGEVQCNLRAENGQKLPFDRILGEQCSA